VGGLALTGCGSSSDGGGGGGTTLTVFAAASLTESFDQLKTTFEAAHSGTTVALSYGGSSTLAEQINQGAPADVFASASVATMKTVTDAGKAAGDPVTFANNILTIVTPPDNTSVSSLEDLAKSDVAVVLCDPAVPCGAVADKMFTATGITPHVVSREADVKSVLAKVESGDADAGIVYVTDAQAAGDQVRQVDIPTSQNQSTEYQIVAVKDAPNATLAGDWITMVTGDEGQSVLKEHGFASP
jgi:molybdate transport system substrate-binding protein